MRRRDIDSWARLSARWAETLTASAFVIAQRTSDIARAGHAPSARDRAEWRRMGEEKVAASGASAWAANLAIAQWWTRLAWQGVERSLAFWSRFPLVAFSAASRSPQRALERETRRIAAASVAAVPRIGGRALTPVRRRAVGNARRLSRRTR